MGRWGQEEKKSQGLLGCFVAFAILSLFSYTFYINYQNLESRRQLERKMQNIVRTGHQKSEAQMIGDIMHEAQQLGLQLGAGDVKLNKKDDGMTNFIVDVEIKFPFRVNVLVTTFQVNVPIKESVHLVIW